MELEEIFKTDLKETNTEVGLDFLYTRVASSGINQDILEQIDEKRKVITENFIKCEKCGKTYGTLIKTDTGYAHKNCEIDTYSYVKNVAR